MRLYDFQRRPAGRLRAANESTVLLAHLSNISCSLMPMRRVAVADRPLRHNYAISTSLAGGPAILAVYACRENFSDLQSLRPCRSAIVSSYFHGVGCSSSYGANYLHLSELIAANKVKNVSLGPAGIISLYP